MSGEAAANTNYGSTASGSSFYAAMRILPLAQREAMFQIYSFCRQVDDIADSDGPREQRLAALQQWRDDIDALYQGMPPARLKDYVASVKAFGLRREDFLAIVDGMEMDVPADIRAPNMATLDLYCDRVASAVTSTTLPIPMDRAPNGFRPCSSGATTSTRSIADSRRRASPTTLPQ